MFVNYIVHVWVLFVLCSPAVVRRLKKELFTILTNPEPMISFSPVEDDIINWKATIKGPVDSPYEGGVFHLKITFPVEYPFKPPKMTFQTKVYHPNIGSTGHHMGCISVRLLCCDWSPALTVSKLLLAIQSILYEADTDHALEPDITREYNTDRAKFNEVARQWTKQYAL